MKFVPNILSSLRIAFSLFLFVLPQTPEAFGTVYVLCGASDVMDGYIARKFKATSNLGAKLDSLADFVFITAILCSLLFFTDIINNTFVLFNIFIVFIIRIVNLIATHVKFDQWASLHSYGNKLSGLLLFFAVPLCIVQNAFPEIVVVPVVIVALLSALEESMIIYQCSSYDVNITGYRQAKRLLL
ncbi:CDP-alcohol phosphatidyltransferase [Actinomycetota bacterium]|nr:CDP-alcohol phosphatidyltransferase [Actinomycetota bacterium]